jgi:hypothetical protein
VMKLWVPSKLENFLTTWVVIDFSRALLHPTTTYGASPSMMFTENFSRDNSPNSQGFHFMTTHKLTTFFWLARQNVQTGDRCAPRSWWSEEKLSWGWTVSLRHGWSTGPEKDAHCTYSSSTV